MKNKKFGSFIKEKADLQGISIDEIYNKLQNIQNQNYRDSKKNITKKTFKKIISNRELPSLDTIYDLSSILNLNPNELLKLKLEIEGSKKRESYENIRRAANNFAELGKPLFMAVYLIIIGIIIVALFLMIEKGNQNMETSEYEDFQNTWKDNVEPLISGNGIEETKIFNENE